MARPGISYEDILEAITKLEAEGMTPSINNVRDTVGRGSPTTISKFLKQWREERATDQTAAQPATIHKNTEDTMQPISENTATAKIKAAKTLKEKPQAIVSDKPSAVTGTMKAQDPIIQALLTSSHALSSDILSSMSDEWSMILNESNPELKVRKLYAALVKEQTRRESAEQVAKEARIYAETLKEQTTQRISDLRDALEGQIAFLNGQIRQLKRESEQTLEYYRKQLEKSNNALAEKKRS
ncbi:DNA-binding protein [Cysteiniphilum sp. QT6929]|uniref:DNA-binding protein n=1 Tax=Cysteiniphilum sp. QT6929 TaxID=2975055 RepID=UPI0024B34DAE|nr:DNA-binding protein [Cysteiniphilum sp. QT6929]WHN64546.1 DNA-binding protein [Cysteiniphilum sp. QT6929]